MAETKTILVVEDNEINMKLVKTLLTIKNYIVLEAGDGEKGIELARIHKPDLILMDIQLPGMDGLTATQAIKSEADLSCIPIVALTSHAMRGDEERALAAGCSGYITKPIDTRSFLAKIHAFLSPSE
ncbi:MAG: response regulator [Deltaproteobacteria bacterium]|nr:response regulator [Deltaproteobacteria bacterium]